MEIPTETTFLWLNPKQGEQDKIPQHFVGIV
jgi:hypothetical protein